MILKTAETIYVGGLHVAQIYICISKSKEEKLDKKQTGKQLKIIRSYLALCCIEKKYRN